VDASRIFPGGPPQGLCRHGRKFLYPGDASDRREVFKCQFNAPVKGLFIRFSELVQEMAKRLSGAAMKTHDGILASAAVRLKVAELPYEFRNRLHGASKLDVNVGLEYLVLVHEKMLGDLRPVRFVLFGIVGSVGVVLNLLELWLLYRVLQLSFITAQAIAAGI